MNGKRLLAWLVVAVSVVACGDRSAPARDPRPLPVPGRDDAAEVTRLADVYVAEFLARFPDRAEGSGLVVRHDGLSDNSLAAVEDWHTREDELAKRVDAIDARALAGRPEWVTLGFLREALASSRGARVCRRELWPVTHYFGWLDQLSELAGSQPVGSDGARRDALARFSRVPRYVDTEIANLHEGVRVGFTSPRSSVELVIAQLDALLAQPAKQWRLFSPAARDGEAAFQCAWTELLEAQIAPAVRRYREYLASEYRGHARVDAAITALPEGRACYRALYREMTSLDRSPEEVMELGQRAVARNTEAALAIGKERMGAGDLPSLAEALRREARFTSGDEELAFARSAVERARATVPRAFFALPPAEVRVEPYPDEVGPTLGDSYRPATDGRPYAFVEGWARYAEGLAEELGLYSSDAARAGRRLWPARGMVVDPGLHVFGWTRERAVAYVAEGGVPPKSAEAMVERIAVRPAQLTAYDSGGLEIMALREQAERELGPRFDLRKFHQAVLEHGAVTLPMLRELVGEWVRRERDR